MAAYLIAFVDVHDIERYTREYVPKILETLAPIQGKILASTDATSVKEGAVPEGRTVIIEFPDLETANTWYNSSEYAPLITLREELASSNLALLPGV